MCQDIQQVTFFCGHQTKFWWGKSRFCLFTGDRATRFHTTYLQFDRNEENCARCQVTQRIKQQGKQLKRPEFRQMIEDGYAKTPDSQQEQEAKSGSRSHKRLVPSLRRRKSLNWSSKSRRPLRITSTRITVHPTPGLSCYAPSPVCRTSSTSRNWSDSSLPDTSARTTRRGSFWIGSERSFSVSPTTLDSIARSRLV